MAMANFTQLWLAIAFFTANVSPVSAQEAKHQPLLARFLSHVQLLREPQ
jgi:hypothetical protein